MNPAILFCTGAHLITYKVFRQIILNQFIDKFAFQTTLKVALQLTPSFVKQCCCACGLELILRRALLSSLKTIQLLPTFPVKRKYFDGSAGFKDFSCANRPSH